MSGVEGSTPHVCRGGESRRERARAAVENAAATLRASGERPRPDVTTAILSGSAKRTIHEDAEAFGADLIVVGAQGHGAFGRFVLGSVSQSVALHAKCSVEIVRRQDGSGD